MQKFSEDLKLLISILSGTLVLLISLFVFNYKVWGISYTPAANSLLGFITVFSAFWIVVAATTASWIIIHHMEISLGWIVSIILFLYILAGSY